METNFIWKERKRNALGLPWTFTKYALTGDRLFITSGLLKTVEDEVRLYRILDISLSQTLTQKIFRIGTIQVSSADKTLGNFEIKNIKDPRHAGEGGRRHSPGPAGQAGRYVAACGGEQGEKACHKP